MGVNSTLFRNDHSLRKYSYYYTLSVIYGRSVVHLDLVHSVLEEPLLTNHDIAGSLRCYDIRGKSTAIHDSVTDWIGLMRNLIKYINQTFLIRHTEKTSLWNQSPQWNEHDESIIINNVYSWRKKGCVCHQRFWFINMYAYIFFFEIIKYRFIAWMRDNVKNQINTV